MRTALLLFGLLTLASCVTKAGVESRYKKLVDAWKAENGDQEPSDDVKAELIKEAERQEKEAAAQEQKEAGQKVKEAVGQLSAGNIVGAALAGLALLGIGVASYKRMRGDS